MKSLIALLVLSSFYATAFAQSPRLLGEARVSGGVEQPPVVFACSVFEDRAFKLLKRGNQVERRESSSTSYDAQLSEAATALALAQQAANGTLSETEGRTGMPTHSYYASADGDSASVFLGSYGPRNFENSAPEARTLRAFLIRNCRWSPR